MNKVYDGTTAATVTLADDRVGGRRPDRQLHDGRPSPTRTSGTGKTVSVSGISISGTDAGNYTVNTTATAQADITQRDLVVSATPTTRSMTAPRATAHLTTTRSAVTRSPPATARPTSAWPPWAARPSPSPASPISGADALNYHLTNTTATATASITGITATAHVTVSDKVYDGTTTATITDCTLTGVLGTDDVSCDLGSASANFQTSDVGSGITVDVTNIGLTGIAAGNYTLTSTTASTFAAITKAASVTTITWSPAVGPYPYKGAAYTATVSVTGAGGLNLNPAPLYTGDCANVTVANGCTASYTYADDGNHTASSASSSITIVKANPTVTVSSSDNPSVYGEPVTFTATISGVSSAAAAASTSASTPTSRWP